MESCKLLIKFMRGKLLKYIASIICVGLNIAFTMLVPIVISITIDSIIGNKPIDAPMIIMKGIEYIGGKSVMAKNIWICSLAIVLITIFRGISIYLGGKWSAEASESTAKNMRDELYKHLQLLSYDYHIKSETGDLIQRCTSDIETVKKFLTTQLVEIGYAVFMLTGVLTVMLSLNIKLTLVAMAVVPIIFIFSIIFFNVVKRTFKVADEAEGKLSNVLQENLTAMRVVRAFGRQSYEIDKFDKSNKLFKDLTYKLMRQLAWYWSLSDFICLLQIAFVLIIGSYLSAKGEITLGTLVVFITYEGLLLWPVRQMGRILSDMGKTIVATSRIKEILDENTEYEKIEQLKPEILGNIEFKNVTFQYDEGKEALKDISFTVGKGQTIAILGPTGSGKTSLVNLLGRLYDYQKGSIKIDGVELKNIDKKWVRSHIGIVLQEPFLYGKTIKANIGIAKENVEDEEIFNVAKDTSIHDVIMGFKNGYDTLVGERGVTLSGGQKQRSAIARILINNYPILAFDDSLSAVDTETDAHIRKALKERNGDTTTFIISHRIGTIAEADLILVLEQGKLTQIGKHEELLNEHGLYKRIWDMQNSLEEKLG
ncbi:ABC transporter ATP-binding protein [Gottschalkia acidurici 9a]|uniref:ABC transporter ATP-binding protein n=1 Tax=Gottschalkia acidurici (strain ATCC 7906 / DSM 604 / BCRC 14475 / CIP 104303 / KCTC 5404 / NCIMB 10678 / 9a) TaxID=1128398 RepID=K0AZF2_GOTA9|nr:ABC transporter ATP-binding protein [Gottschalkia acidurici]AFS77751.1 ABC transporter ATP-binding protein [Gottschalkia acidurici 9a]